MSDRQSGKLKQVVKDARARAKTFDYDETYNLVRDRMAQATRSIVQNLEQAKT
jgi:hypothetical protein